MAYYTMQTVVSTLPGKAMVDLSFPGPVGLFAPIRARKCNARFSSAKLTFAYAE